MKRLVPLLVFVLVSGCVSTGWEHRTGEAAQDLETEAVAEVVASSPAPGLPADVVSDREQIQKSLSTMDPYEDRSIPMAKMRGLVKDGLYDPENKNPLEVGEEAPDFELRPLRYYDLGQGKIDKANAGDLFAPVRLSSFRDRLPVVLIFGSYT